MKSKKLLLFPKHQKMLEQVGENYKLARKRRKLTMEQVAERAARLPEEAGAQAREVTRAVEEGLAELTASARRAADE